MRRSILVLLCLSLAGGAAYAQDATIDDFDGYADTNALRVNWFGSVFLETGTVNSPPNSLRPGTGTLGANFGSSYLRTLSPAIVFRSGTLTFRYYVSDSLTTVPAGGVRFQIQLFDGNTNCSLSPEITPLSRDSWNLASLDVPSTCGATNLGSVTELTLVVRNRSSTSGVVTAYFDDFVITGAVPVEFQRFSVE